jgi:thymidine kinase
MAKLYFRHGAVSSAKTLNLLAVAHNYRSQGKEVLLMKPAMDTRFGKDSVRSRAGLKQDADVLIDETTDLLAISAESRKNVSCVLVDEAQFLSPIHIDQLRTISLEWRVPVIAYGLRTDFRTNLFPGSRRLMEVADTIEEVKTTCYFCNKKAVMNLKHVDGKADTRGPAVQLGAEEKYFPACFGCYRESLIKAGQLPADAHWTLSEVQQADQNAMLMAKDLSSVKLAAAAVVAVSGQVPVHFHKADVFGSAPVVVESSTCVQKGGEKVFSDKENDTNGVNVNVSDTHAHVFHQSSRTNPVVAVSP